MPGTHNQFTPATSATFAAMGTLPTQIALPPVDPSNTAVLLQNVGGGTLFVFAGWTNGGPIGAAPGVIALQEREQRMLPSTPGFGNSTVATIQSTAGSGQLAFTRGSVTPVWIFPAAVTAVI